MSPLRARSATRSTKRDTDAVDVLEALVVQLGIGRVVGLLAEIVARRSDAVLLSGEHLKAGIWLQDAKILERAARALDGD
jgi:hypothetical protein